MKTLAILLIIDLAIAILNGNFTDSLKKATFHNIYFHNVIHAGGTVLPAKQNDDLHCDR